MNLYAAEPVPGSRLSCSRVDEGRHGAAVRSAVRTPAIRLEGSVTASAASPLSDAIAAVEPALDYVVSGLAGEAFAPVTWVITDDFANSVAGVLDPTGAMEFTTDRVGGEVVAKTMRDGDGYSIVLNAELLCGDAPDLTSLVFLAAHELTHVAQYQLRDVADIRLDLPDGEIRRSAHLIMHLAANEYRADRVAALVVANGVSVRDEAGETRQASILDTFAGGHISAAEDVAASMHSQLPDIVMDYRLHRMPLMEAVTRVVQFTDQAATVLGHWQALCDVVGVEEPWSLGELPHLEATDLYLRPLWDPVRDLIHDTPLILSPDELQDHETELTSVGASVVEAFWAQLGVTVEELPDGREYVHVAPP